MNVSPLWILNYCQVECITYRNLEQPHYGRFRPYLDGLVKHLPNAITDLREIRVSKTNQA